MIINIIMNIPNAVPEEFEVLTSVNCGTSNGGGGVKVGMRV